MAGSRRWRHSLALALALAALQCASASLRFTSGVHWYSSDAPAAALPVDAVCGDDGTSGPLAAAQPLVPSPARWRPLHVLALSPATLVVLGLRAPGGDSGGVPPRGDVLWSGDGGGTWWCLGRSDAAVARAGAAVFPLRYPWPDDADAGLQGVCILGGRPLLPVVNESAPRAFGPATDMVACTSLGSAGGSSVGDAPDGGSPSPTPSPPPPVVWATAAPVPATVVGATHLPLPRAASTGGEGGSGRQLSPTLQLVVGGVRGDGSADLLVPLFARACTPRGRLAMPCAWRRVAAVASPASPAGAPLPARLGLRAAWLPAVGALVVGGGRADVSAVSAPTGGGASGIAAFDAPLIDPLLSQPLAVGVADVDTGGSLADSPLVDAYVAALDLGGLEAEDAAGFTPPPPGGAEDVLVLASNVTAAVWRSRGLQLPEAQPAATGHAYALFALPAGSAAAGADVLLCAAGSRLYRALVRAEAVAPDVPAVDEGGVSSAAFYVVSPHFVHGGEGAPALQTTGPGQLLGLPQWAAPAANSSASSSSAPADALAFAATYDHVLLADGASGVLYRGTALSCKLANGGGGAGGGTCPRNYFPSGCVGSPFQGRCTPCHVCTGPPNATVCTMALANECGPCEPCPPGSVVSVPCGAAPPANQTHPVCVLDDTGHGGGGPVDPESGGGGDGERGDGDGGGGIAGATARGARLVEAAMRTPALVSAAGAVVALVAAAGAVGAAVLLAGALARWRRQQQLHAVGGPGASAPSAGDALKTPPSSPLTLGAWVAASGAGTLALAAGALAATSALVHTVVLLASTAGAGSTLGEGLGALLAAALVAAAVGNAAVAAHLSRRGSPRLLPALRRWAAGDTPQQMAAAGGGRDSPLHPPAGSASAYLAAAARVLRLALGVALWPPLLVAPLEAAGALPFVPAPASLSPAQHAAGVAAPPTPLRTALARWLAAWAAGFTLPVLVAAGGGAVLALRAAGAPPGGDTAQAAALANVALTCGACLALGVGGAAAAAAAARLRRRPAMPVGAATTSKVAAVAGTDGDGGMPPTPSPPPLYADRRARAAGAATPRVAGSAPPPAGDAGAVSDAASALVANPLRVQRQPQQQQHQAPLLVPMAASPPTPPESLTAGAPDVSAALNGMWAAAATAQGRRLADMRIFFRLYPHLLPAAAAAVVADPLPPVWAALLAVLQGGGGGGGGGADDRLLAALGLPLPPAAGAPAAPAAGVLHDDDNDDDDDYDYDDEGGEDTTPSSSRPPVATAAAAAALDEPTTAAVAAVDR